MQFVSQFDSFYPSSRRRALFLAEFEKRQSTYNYWEAAMIETLAYLESYPGKLMVTKRLRSFGDITSEKDLEVLTLLLVRESYNFVMAQSR